MVDIIIYSLIFLMGAFFGSFFSLAVYRIPLGENITHKHSFCPNCKHKLGILELIPIFSYIFLGGKCKNCKEKIKIRYVLLEIFSGLTFLIFAISLNINFSILEISKIIYFGFAALYFCGLFIIAGIDKEKNIIQKSVLVYNLLITTAYIIYLYIVEHANIYRYIMYLIIMLILIIIDTLILKKKARENYPIEILTLCICISIFSGEIVFILTVIYCLLAIAIQISINKLKQRKNKYRKSEKGNENIIDKIKVPIGFYLCSINIIVLIVINYIVNFNIY